MRRILHTFCLAVIGLGLSLSPLALAGISVQEVPTLPLAPQTPLVKYCAVQIIRDNALIFAYKPVIRLHPSCSRRAQARVRKSSTLNTRRNGAPYQPIRPEKGAWTVTASGTTIPNRDLWTTWSWRWEYWDGTHWRPAEVL
ncbi:hypothetical protein GCM10008955_01410 [Deinococcus malanensis]|uniref:Secreted protein n=1 Tax=Deinococcus malanensis TaxID=1706855 RepID=A0ABQ2EJL3_9DEIO|nr:hypothetical protein [Deinococcus malanensis]GGK11879.1 hypothetical protein GCM10008955_01410 [Deinococcus malanensis]